MKAKKLICLAFPLILVAGVGCSKDNAEEKQTDNVKVEDSKDTKQSDTVKPREEDFMKIVDAEIDKAYKRKETKNKSNDKVVKEEVKEETKMVASEEENANRTLAEERASDDKQIIREVNPPVTLKQYKEQIETQTKQFIDALQATKPIVEKDKTLKTNKEELRKQFKLVQEQGMKIKELDPPTEYSYFREALSDDMKVIVLSIEGAFEGLDANDNAKTESSLSSMYHGLGYLEMTLDEIAKTE
ncbi:MULTISPECIES: hypothetical protein [Bacillus cereus group]|uniref:hypothetical protein n=1 Tax=Bacillus cereus group TaxID=86661 RepID=UPI0011C8334B|nr:MULTISPECIES: hypothetical protein [Bacillus cereus group]QWG80483.1 hypothetical protein EXW27_23960 [Bacillus mycoides]TXR88574.1 hypothetical protein DN408_07535 [Bacillus sp. AR13-1]